MVAFAHSPCFQGSQVRTRAWLGITLTPPVFAAQNPGQVLLLLFFGAELDDDRSHHIYAEGNGAGHTVTAGLFIPDVLLDRGPADTSVLFRPVRGVPALLAENFLPPLVVFLAQLAKAFHLGCDVCRQLGIQKCANFVAESQFLG